MEKEFIPYEQALALKELGFDEPCMYAWCITREYRIKYDGKISLKTDGNPFGQFYKGKSFNGKYSPNKNKIQCSAPTFSQAFRYFREKYDLVIEPCVPFQRLYSTEEDYFEILEFGYRIYSFDQFRGGLRDKIEWDGYDNSNEEEAELECLKKLIEICTK